MVNYSLKAQCMAAQGQEHIAKSGNYLSTYSCLKLSLLQKHVLSCCLPLRQLKGTFTSVVSINTEVFFTHFVEYVSIFWLG